MNRRSWLMSVATAIGSSPFASATTPSDTELARLLRGLLLANMPAPLFDKHDEWGKTKEYKVLKLRKGKPVWERQARNDGLWRRSKLTAINPAESLAVDVTDIAATPAGATALTVTCRLTVRAEADQEQWESGLRLYGAGVRARIRLRTQLRVEAALRPEFKSGLPDVVVSLKVTHAEVGYDDIIVEHVAGLGGDAAKILGRTGHDLLNQWKPSVERELKEKAVRAIIKAGELREFRVGLGRLANRK